MSIAVLEEWVSDERDWRIVEHKPSLPPPFLVLQRRDDEGPWREMTSRRLHFRGDLPRIVLVLRAQAAMWKGEGERCPYAEDFVRKVGK